jgi:hypothetical protein
MSKKDFRSWHFVTSSTVMACLVFGCNTALAENSQPNESVPKNSSDSSNKSPATSTVPADNTPSNITATPSSAPSNSAVPSDATATSAMPLAGTKLEDVITKRYLECHDGFMNAKNFEESMRFSSQKNRDEFQKKMSQLQSKGGDKDLKALQGIYDLMRMMRPRKIKVTRVVVKDDQAVLTATSSDPGELGEKLGNGMNAMMSATMGATTKQTPMYTKCTGDIKMVKEGGEWMIDHESWNSESSNLTPQQQAKKKAETAWCAQAATLPFPQKPAAGKLHGQPFTVTRAEMSPNLILSLKEGNDFLPDREVTIFIFDMKGAPDGQSIIEKEGNSVTKAHCHVHYRWKPLGKESHTEALTGFNRFGIRLVFGKRKDGRLPGYIVLRMPDKEKSFVEGYFYIPAKG